MFGLGFSEILVICTVALLVLGPKRLPEVTRTLGRSLGQLRRAADEFKREITFPKLDLESDPDVYSTPTPSETSQELTEVKDYGERYSPQNDNQNTETTNTKNLNSDCKE